MTPSPRRVAIVGGVRIPFARANTAYNEASNQQMLTTALKSLVSRCHLENERIGEVAAGAVIKHSRDWNLARESTLGSGLHPETPAYDVQRACGTSLTAAVQVAHRIAAGEIECGIAGGVDSASDIPLSYGPELQKIVLSSVHGRTAGERRAAHRAFDGAARRRNGEGMAHRPRRAGPARGCEPSQRGGGVEGRL